VHLVLARARAVAICTEHLMHISNQQSQHSSGTHTVDDQLRGCCLVFLGRTSAHVAWCCPLSVNTVLLSQSCVTNGAPTPYPTLTSAVQSHLDHPQLTPTLNARPGSSPHPPRSARGSGCRCRTSPARSRPS
jgi:hypothetical protein